jgi:hypothetical protein
MKTSSFVYVAIDNDNVPIATSNNREELFKAVDYHVGAHEKFKNESTRVDWEPYNPKYPSDYEGRLLYDCPTYLVDGGREVIAIRVYTVEHFIKQKDDDTTTVDREVSEDF